MRILVSAVVIGLVVAAASPVRLAAQAPATAGDMFDEWNQQAVRSIVTVAGYNPPVANIHMAIVHLAVYDAVVSVTGRYVPYSAVPASPGGSIDAAVATAAHDVLVGLFSAQKTDLDARLTSTLAKVADGRSKRAGMAAGARAAEAMLKARAGDGRFASVPFTPGTLAGMWAPTPPAAYVFPWIGSVKPLGIRFPSQFRPAGPPAMESAKYAEEFNEVKRLGGRQSTARTAEQREIGLFWTDNVTPQWNRTLLAMARTRGMGVSERTRLFATLWTSVADAHIGCWNAKSYYSFWRPIDAIRRADLDGNPATEADPTWESLVPTPPYPDYPSGHICMDGAVAEVVDSYFGPTAPLAVDSLVTNTTRRFAGAGEMVKEVIEARIYIGLHFRSADVDAAALGRRTARYIMDRYFLPRSP